MRIKIFLELSGGFVNTHIDAKNDNIENFKMLKKVKEKRLVLKN